MKKIITRILLALSLITPAVLVANQSTAGATVPCNISGDGWFINGTKINRCTWNNGNQMIIEQFDGNTYEGVIFNGWIPTNLVATIFYIDEDPAGGYSPARIIFCPLSSGGKIAVEGTSPGTNGWERDFRFLDFSGWSPPGAAGSFNHFNNWPGLQAYGLYTYYDNCNGSAVQGTGFQLVNG